MNDAVFVLPTAPSGRWDKMTENEKVWIELIRVISCGRDPFPSSSQIDSLIDLLSSA